MPLNSNDIKQQLSEIYLVSKKNIKRISKKKNIDKNCIERIFSLGEITLLVQSDIDDEKIIKTSRCDLVAVKKEQHNIFSDYFFAISTRLVDDEYYLVSIIRKDFWNAHHLSDDQPCPIEYQLPEYISDLNESSEMAAYLDDWTIAFNDLEQLGMEYNNELALFLDGFFNCRMHLKQ